MKLHIRPLLLCALLWSLPFLGGNAAESVAADSCQKSALRVTEHQYLWGMGKANVLDTYLSPLEYTGIDWAWLNSTERLARWGRGHVTVMGLYNAHFAYVKSPTDDGKEMDAELTASGGWHYNWHFPHQWRVAVGGLMEMSGGFTYNTRNGNNPAQGRLGASLLASAILERAFRMGNKQAQARVELDAQMMGAQFAPAYGQSYYEIFSLGHSSGVVRFTHLGNCPTGRLLASLTLPIRRSKITVGYLGDVRQSTLGGLKRHAWRNALMVGYTRNISRL